MRKTLTLALVAFALLTALPRESRAEAVPGAQSFYAPAVASYNGLAYIIYIRASDSRLAYQTSPTGTVWSGETLIPLGTTPEAKPAAAVYNNRLYVFYTSQTGTALRFRSLDSSGTWSAETLVNGSSTDDGPGLAVFNGLLYVFWETAGSGSDRIRYITIDTSGAQSLVNTVPIGLTFKGPGAAVFNNRLYLAYSATNGSVSNGANIYYSYMDAFGNWYGDWRPTGDPRTQRGPALAALGTELWLLYQAGLNGNFQCYDKRLNTLDQWTAEAPNIGVSDSGVNATVHDGDVWLVGRRDFSFAPNSVQYYILP